ncbi:helix-turn-helix transcriptional regulator [Lactococcus lactis subsp. lactis]|uniref:helix-turn-helix domain-containing protein n=1 Tax=Lactococcus lactis TaxID=1358 RepID=UPI0007AE9C26|nr:helix-turn-helix transcriptional regulator [Lactococcus lactis]KZK13225.1 Transcriptional regulator XRE family [Lactococcus lactis subsp. lactis bv. diacetylactis]MCT3103678.1 XRE family transcriptional regulator [Lactococcus lactis]MRL66853.1 helix-turn-helix domain-containing protein [Lactococcus lactis subsp. lactis]QTP13005.1 helix-turn-helix transcriptional regulator [Lactococcus lactis subsp. lactis]
MERIKIARQKKGISQKDLADLLGLTQQAVSYYEKGSRIPDEQTLSVISDILNVPTEYLTGETDDPEGWDLWEDATGYTPEQIKKEIKRMKSANHIVGDDKNLQNLIGQAVSNLSGMGNTDRGILNSLVPKIIDLQQELSKKYEDPEKLDKLPHVGKMRIRPGNIRTADLIYDDLNDEAYNKAMDILMQARRDLANISSDLRLN